MNRFSELYNRLQISSLNRSVIDDWPCKRTNEQACPVTRSLMKFRLSIFPRIGVNKTRPIAEQIVRAGLYRVRDVSPCGGGGWNCPSCKWSCDKSRSQRRVICRGLPTNKPRETHTYWSSYFPVSFFLPSSPFFAFPAISLSDGSSPTKSRGGKMGEGRRGESRVLRRSWTRRTEKNRGTGRLCYVNGKMAGQAG